MQTSINKLLYDIENIPKSYFVHSSSQNSLIEKRAVLITIIKYLVQHPQQSKQIAFDACMTIQAMIVLSESHSPLINTITQIRLNFLQILRNYNLNFDPNVINSCEFSKSRLQKSTLSQGVPKQQVTLKTQINHQLSQPEVNLLGKTALKSQPDFEYQQLIQLLEEQSQQLLSQRKVIQKLRNEKVELQIQKDKQFQSVDYQKVVSQRDYLKQKLIEINQYAKDLDKENQELRSKLKQENFTLSAHDVR
ncbi:Hypothetical_protein [Hexamita inflata]|uniref:Hypothetical_protein n=1 Tax=Hexamita inflata TaxID=28002 RepID=A0AA86VCT8_9EUKA|nr:Hypothetical protein HINF_LOCUS50688 [Hexamita inflata]